MAAENELDFVIKAIDQASKQVGSVADSLKTLKKDSDNTAPSLDKTAKAAKDVGETSKESTGHASKFGGALSNVSQIAGGFVLGQGLMKAPGFLMDAAKGAAADEQATMRLQQAVRNLGGDYDETMASVNDAIDQGQTLAFTDDDIRDSFISLASATGDSEEALKRQKAAMDLARGANIPLTTAARMLGKMTEENVEVFKKMGITIGDNATEADALAAIQKKFGGQAEEYANSTAGQFEIMQIKMAEVQETIGYALLPVMAALGTVLAEQVVPAIEQFAALVGPALESAFGFIVDNQDIIVPILIGVAGAIVTAMIPATLAWAAAEAIKAAALLASAAAFVIANAPMIAMIAVIALVIAGIVLLVQHWDEITAKIPALGTAFDAVWGVLKAFGAFITDVYIPFWIMVYSTVFEQVTKAVKFVVDHWDEIKAPFVAFGKFVNDTYIAFWVKVYTTVAENIKKAIDFVKDHWDEIKDIIVPAIKAMGVEIETALNVILDIWKTAFKLVQDAFNIFKDIFTGDWGKLKDDVIKLVTDLKDGAVAIFGDLVEGVQGVVPLMLSAATALGGAIIDGIRSGVGAAGGIAMDIASTIVSAVKSLINSQVISRINSALEFTITMPGEIPNFHVNPPDIPWLASGTRNFAGGWAVVGDAGPELLNLPKGSNVFSNRDSRQMLNSGPTVQIEVNGPVYANSEAQANEFFGDMGYAMIERLRSLGEVA